MTSAFDQFKDFLREMFQYDTNDLDFGIFKILKLKRKYLEQFISGDGPEDLYATVARELAKVEKVDAEAARNWLTSFAALFGDMGRPVWADLEAEPLDEAKQARFRSLFALPLVSDSQREEAERHLSTWLESQKSNTATIEERLYNYLLNFFELYYQNGDFGYNSRAANAFKVPYEADYDGSDTFFHWKHKDSYYIKTGASFPSVKCEVAGKKLEFRLETGADSEAETTAQNNNKDKEIKLYRLARIEEQDSVWQVVFHLAKTGTEKTELYPKLWATVFDAGADLTPYLFKKEVGSDPAKPIFNDLAADYDKTDSGQVKGVNQLRLKEESYYKELAKRPEFAGLGRNEADRAEALKANPTASALFQLDKALNQFYVGNDADYFIHKDLRGFLTREKDRFIKNVVFSDLDTLLNRNIDNTTLIIGRGFNAVATRIIEFLDTLETFQRNIFTLKKKVIDTHWLISVGKIPERFHAAIAANDGQVRQFSEMYGVTITDGSQLKEHPTLVVDTSLFAPEWTLELLSDPAFDNLDEQTDGVLIHSENWQALNLLKDKYRQNIKCIYMDPPYNTGGDGFLYKDSFRHSSWVTMVEERIRISASFVSDNGVSFVSIDQNERHNLDHVYLQTHGVQNRIGEIIWKNVTDNNPTTIACEHEYIICFAADKASVESPWKSEISDVKEALIKVGRELIDKHDDLVELRAAYQDWYRENKPFLGQMDGYKFIDKDGVYCGSRSVHNPGKEGYRYDVPHNVTGKPCKQPLMGYRFPEDTMKRLLAEDRIIFGDDENKIIELKVYAHEYEDKLPSVITLDGRSGANDLRSMFPGEKRFKNPKTSALLESVFPFIVHGGDTVLDFFAGSGTTAQAVIRLNQKDKERRKFILTEMAPYFDDVLKPRVAKVLASSTWNDGLPTVLDGSEGIVKVQRLEQYEDLLANLETAWDGETLPKGLPVQYLFRPEHNKLVASLDLSRPFNQTLKAGKAREEKAIDLMETWLYLQGYWVKSRRVYCENGRKYLAVETTIGVLVVFRDIDTGEDDSAALNAIIDRYTGESGEPTVTRLEVNFDADIRKVKLPVSLVQAADFDRGASWN